MKRSARTVFVFIAALALVLTVMVFFTVRMLQFEKAVAMADARAAAEENIRLALWRMDSAAARLLAQNPRRSAPASGNRGIYSIDNNIAPQKPTLQNEQRLNANYQSALNREEFQQRLELNATGPGDWRKLEPILLDRIGDILPGAHLEPVSPATVNPDDTRRLASIPARLVAPAWAFAAPVLPWNTPLRISLMIAWICAAIAALAVALLLRGALALSERRGAFVSAVTHELRTPLTTFRMYSEMLASGMVAEPASRQQYLDTLVSESDRLGHLIENVLAYARLERQLSPSRAQSIRFGELLERTIPALQRRAQQAGLPLNVSWRQDDADVMCQTDTIAVQQILANLVDNACKYGQSLIDITISLGNGNLECRVADQGPGLEPAANQRLFSAFSKSKSDATPGIGLGLFLSRRLARALGGDLRHVPAAAGATFVLTLPVGDGAKIV